VHSSISTLDHTHWHTHTHTHSVCLYWTRDRSVAKTSTCPAQISQQTNIHAPGWIRTRNLSQRIITRPKCSWLSRLLDFETIGIWKWKDYQPYASAAFTLQEIFLVDPDHFCQTLSRPRAHSAPGRFMSIRQHWKSNLHLPSCSAVPQETAQPRAPQCTYVACNDDSKQWLCPYTAGTEHFYTGARCVLCKARKEVERLKENLKFHLHQGSNLTDVKHKEMLTDMRTSFSLLSLSLPIVFYVMPSICVNFCLLYGHQCLVLGLYHRIFPSNQRSRTF
jgi:hypothetical protein